MSTKLLLMRLEAPLMSFGGVAVDKRGVTDPYPGIAMLTGLLGNALGYEHGDHELLTRLQDRLRLGVRCDVPGQLLTDFQTVDLGQPSLILPGWTTRGVVEARAGGEASSKTHIRLQSYLADAVFTVALGLEPADEPPTIDALASALAAPERPLFIGRKACLPSAPLLLGIVEADGLVQALRGAPLHPRARGATGTAPTLSFWLPGDGSTVGPTPPIPTRDHRDWRNQVHTGRRWLTHHEWAVEVADAGR